MSPIETSAHDKQALILREGGIELTRRQAAIDAEARDAADALAAAESDRIRRESATIEIDGVTVRRSVAKNAEWLFDALTNLLFAVEKYTSLGGGPSAVDARAAIAEAEGLTGKESK